jgi:HTH-type transcriptional regulator / antitoxin HigA
MPTEPLNTFRPDYATPPGQTLLEILETVGLSQAELAERTGRPKKTINEIIKGKAAVTPETALQFERVLGIAASFWVSLEQHYRQALARSEERTRLAQYVDWLKRFPISDLISRQWIKPKADKVELVQEVLSFFGVASPEAWDEVWSSSLLGTSFRQAHSRTGDFGVIAAWLRRGEIQGRELECQPYSSSRFKEALRKIRELTRDQDINRACELMIKECSLAGVAVVLIPELPRLRVCGATRWLSAEKALLQLSLFYKRDDQFWFSFFHEAAHILLHGKKEIFVDEANGSQDREEKEANKFAAEYLIPHDEYMGFIDDRNFTASQIIKFANRLKISPSIVVGRLQHDKVIKFSERNDLHVRVDWVS